VYVVEAYNGLQLEKEQMRPYVQDVLRIAQRGEQSGQAGEQEAAENLSNLYPFIYRLVDWYIGLSIPRSLWLTLFGMFV